MLCDYAFLCLVVWSSELALLLISCQLRNDNEPMTNRVKLTRTHYLKEWNILFDIWKCHEVNIAMKGRIMIIRVPESTEHWIPLYRSIEGSKAWPLDIKSDVLTIKPFKRTMMSSIRILISEMTNNEPGDFISIDNTSKLTLLFIKYNYNK